jgi:glycosyltransferase involved in cell wall biosynthesis
MTKPTTTNTRPKPRICLLALPFLTPSMYDILGKFLHLMENVAGSIYLIANRHYRPRDSDKVHLSGLTPLGPQRWRLLWVLKYLRTEIEMAWHILRLAHNIDIVIYRLGSTAILPTLVARLLRLPVLTYAAAAEAHIAKVEYQQGSLAHRLITIQERLSYATSDMIVVASETLVGHLGLDNHRDKVRLAYPHFIDTERFSIRKPVNERGHLVGFVGRLRLSKGPLELARAIPLILANRPEAQFFFIGDGPLKVQIRKELEASGCIRNVTFTGWVPNESIPNYLNQIKFHILPSYSETVGWANLEAMACGAIVIANAVGGVPEIVRDGETGFLLRNNSPEEIATKILEAWDHPNLHSIQLQARTLVEREFTYERAVDSWSHLLQQAVDRDLSEKPDREQ